MWWMRFPDWAARRDWQTLNALPAHQRLMLLLSMAGQQGMSRGNIGSLVDLPAEELNDLLVALVKGGELALMDRNGKRVYRRLL
jgi:hypothetical protein